MIVTSIIDMTINRLLDKLFRQHRKELLAFAERQPSANLAEDIVQETYLRLMQHPDLASIQNHRAYLFKTASNLSNNQYAYDQVRSRHLIDDPIELDSLISPLPSLDLTINAHQQIDRFMSVLGQLPEAYQHAFILNKFEGLSYQEVAVSLVISSKSAQRYIIKAWQHLLQHLGDDFFDDDLTL
jgi:RNA polymerase sigma-70 factor (ECF subfamily)